MNVFHGHTTRQAYVVLRVNYEYDPVRGGFVDHYEDKDFAQRGGNPSYYSKSVSVELVQRLVWLWHHEAWPPEKLHPANGDKWDTRIENLGMILRDGYVEGFADQWTVYDHKKKRYGPKGTYPTWQAACAAYDVGDLV